MWIDPNYQPSFEFDDDADLKVQTLLKRLYENPDYIAIHAGKATGGLIIEKCRRCDNNLQHFPTGNYCPNCKRAFIETTYD